jgi:cellulose synthase/poly-beta-1,6-N-acetylglucosamine synthase-like glycosyltransferase
MIRKALLPQKVANTAAQAGYFFVPKKQTSVKRSIFNRKNTAVIIPTYKPSSMTTDLIEFIVKNHPKVLVVVVDDCTPVTVETSPTLSKINWLAANHMQVISLRTPKNALKAGALNYGIEYLKSLAIKPDAVFTFDDDVVINEKTIPAMVDTLFSSYRTGAVCSQVRITNKNANALTRLQGLEYHGFNITKISDNGFLKGPLVMQGMLTGFRMEVLEQTEGFSTNHLIEDYDITARMKIKGWEVKIAKDAIAWTEVPETVESLWRQRARWTSGGLHVLGQYWKHIPSVFQDFVGHASFLSLFVLIGLSFMYADSYTQTKGMVPILTSLAWISFSVSTLYNIAVMKAYADRDAKDWALKLTVLPELVYSNFLSMVLLGSYAFHFYNISTNRLLSTLTYIISLGHSAFSRVGYSAAWGTR